MAWIESHTVLSRHRKLKELARSLRLKPVYVMGHLHALWHDALEQQDDGDLTKWSDELIAESSQFDGDAPQYVSLLQEHGWLDGRLIHDWLEYAGGYLAGRYHNSNRVKLIEIWAKHGKEYGRKKEGTEKEIYSIAPNQTLPDLTLPTKPTSTPAAKAAPSKRFFNPKPEEVKAYGLTIGFKIDGNAFCDHYEAKGWKIGKSPMVSWQAAVRTWKKDAPATAFIRLPKPKSVDVEQSEEDRQEVLKIIASAKAKTIPKDAELDRQKEQTL